jgi:hypothetical protein
MTIKENCLWYLTINNHGPDATILALVDVAGVQGLDAEPEALQQSAQLHHVSIGLL